MIDHPEVKRLLKYGTVGISSLIVGFAIFDAFYYMTHRLVFSQTMSYAISVLNGFIFNRRWTFKEKRGESVWSQCAKFAVVNLVGYTINVVVVALLVAEYTRIMAPRTALSTMEIAHDVLYHSKSHVYSIPILNCAGLIATVFVTIWNFAINRAWTFRH